MATVHFKLKEINSNQPTSIYLIFSFGFSKVNERTGKKVYIPLKYSTKLKVHPHYWNSETARVNENSDFQGAKEINDRLNEIEYNIQDIYRKLVDRKIQILPWILSRELNLRMGRKSKKRSLSFFDFAEKFVEHAKLRKSPATIAKYQTTIKHVQNYAEFNSKTIDFESFNLHFYKDFTNYMREELNFSQNTIAKYIAALKLILNEASVKGVNKNLSFKHKNFKIKTEKSSSLILSEEDILKIENTKFENSRLENVKEIFLFLCYSGLSYIELGKLKSEDFVTEKGSEYIKVKFKRETRYVPLHWRIKSIFNKEKELPKIISQQRFNEYLKEVSKVVFEEEIENGNKKYLNLSTDTARKTFMILLYNKKVNIETILYYSGYKQTPAFLMRVIAMNKNEEDLFVHHPFFERN